MRTTVDNIKRGGREHVWGFDARELGKVLVQRDVLLGCCSLGCCNGYAEDGIGTELALVGCAVELDQEVVDLSLLRDFEARLDQCGCDGVVDVSDGLGNTFAGK